ncbi:MAG TPA: endonuclease [Geminicoccaceae bacterium]|nr:endonuclease [Geminicoccaceae bacterium]
MQRVAVRVAVMAGAALLGVILLARGGLIDPTGAGRMAGSGPDIRLALSSAPPRIEPVPSALAPGEDADVAAVRAWLHRQVQGHHVLRPDKVLMALDELEVDPERPENLVLIYSRRSVPRKQGEGEGGDAWLREHLWPASRGFADRDDVAYGDLHNLRVEDPPTRAARGSRDFAAVTAAGAAADDYGFEPPDVIKGDVARALFYMAVRYQGEGSDPALTLVDRWTRDGEPALGRLCTLLDWHEEDPVDSEERRRNRRVERYQGNRNPFVDRPEFARVLWGRQCR